MKKVVYNKDSKSIMVQVVLGNPRIGCDGYGICKFITKTDSVNFIKPDRLLKAYLCVDDGQLHLVFNKAEIPQTVYQTHFSEGIFRIETEIQLPKTITDLFGIAPSVFICGKYKIQVNRINLLIFVDIKIQTNSSSEADKKLRIVSY